MSRTSPRTEEAPETRHSSIEYTDAPDHPPSEQPTHPREGGSTPRHPPTPEVDSQVPVPAGVHVPASEADPDRRFADAFNDAEDERRLRHQDAERMRDERAAEAEARRDDEFREHEAERQRIFEAGENKRNQTSEEARQAIFKAAEEQRDLTAADAESSRSASIRSAIEEVVSRQGSVRMGDWEDERARLNEEHEQMCEQKVKELEEQWAEERARLVEKVEALQDERTKAEEEFLNLRDTTEAQRIERERVETERIEQQQVELQQRDQGLRDQLAEITNMLHEKKAECERLQALHDERYAAKEERRVKKDVELQELKDLVKGIMDENEKAKALAAEEKERDAGRPGVSYHPTLRLVLVLLFLRSRCCP